MQLGTKQALITTLVELVKDLNKKEQGVVNTLSLVVVRLSLVVRKQQRLLNSEK